MHHKMPQMSICRMCLGTDLRMITIAGTPLQAVYEKVTEAELLDNMKPVVACYICLAQLKRCRTFMEKSVKADEVLNGILMNSKLTIKSVARIDRNAYKLNHPLSIKVIPSEDQEELDVRKVKKELEFEFAGADVSHVEINFDQQTDYPQLNEPIVNIDEKFGQPVVAQVLDVGFLKEEGKEEPAVSDTDDFRDAVSDDDVPLRPAVKKRKRNSDGEVKPKKVKVEGAKKASAKRTGKQKRYKFTNIHSSEDETTANRRLQSLKIIRIGKRLKYVCDFCKLSFAERTQVRKHLIKEHKPFECKVCHKRWENAAQFLNHAIIHTGEKPYECKVCHSRFAVQGGLRIHSSMHSDEKRFQCNICGKRFRLNSLLKRHLSTHTGEARYQCHICHRKFTQRGSMLRHVKRHSGDKPYQCHICNRKLCAKETLEVHLRTHAGEKPFSCDYCKRKFTRKQTLKAHLKKHPAESIN
ncbi:zinc finger protein 558-like isoform X8 [Plodia interpunctella]|uniref:zinc finger protein 558-like isoform X8 n=1 Tax=Plodia interpunctella TaxID=58824 RepID=UPI0023686BC3|nr:zinc finger protein 558-like isoform X8 [Plodia interpunctella]